MEDVIILNIMDSSTENRMRARCKHTRAAYTELKALYVALEDDYRKLRALYLAEKKSKGRS
jgi:hypothetical protein